jgi:ProP effector
MRRVMPEEQAQTDRETNDTPAAPAPARPPHAPIDLAACAARLAERFPALFGGPPKPIKLRIQTDIQERAPGVFAKAELSAFLRRHTATTAYLVALTKAPGRVDLDGAPAGELSDEHRRIAAEELARRRTRHEEKRRLEDQQRRNRATLLRDFERTTLTAANFCALKGVAPEELDGLLARARSEAQEMPRPAAEFPRGPQRRPGRRPEPRR